MNVMRLGHLRLNVLDIDQAVEHYCGTLGLLEQCRDDDGAVYLKGWDEWDLYSLVLVPSDRAGYVDCGYKVRRDGDLDGFQKAIEAYGISTEMKPAGAVPHCGRSLHFQMPSGHPMCLFSEKEQVGKMVGVLNPDPWPDGLKGAAVHWLDHIMLMCPAEPGVRNTVQENTDFFEQVLDFKLAEQVIGGPEGDFMAASWMARTTTPHDIAFGAGPVMGIHHMSFFVDEWHDVLRTADILAKRDVKIDVTPQRHGITRGSTTYFFDPSGNRCEVFAGLGYLTQPDMPTITWNEEQLWRGIFYHTGDMIGDFLGVYT